MTKDEILSKYFPEEIAGVRLLRIYVPVIVTDQELECTLSFKTLMRHRYEKALQSCKEFIQERIDELE